MGNLHKPGKDSGSPVGSVTSLPLTNGKAIEVAYLSWLVGTGLAAPSTHNQYIQALVYVISKEQQTAGSPLPAVYRNALQDFLRTSRDYDCAPAQAAIPADYTEEQALLLSRLGQHDQVLGIYLHELQDLGLCESYCDRIYSAACEIPMIAQTDALAQVQAASPAPALPARGNDGGPVPSALLPSSYATSDKLFDNTKTVVTAADVDAADVYLSFIKTLVAALPSPTEREFLSQGGGGKKRNSSITLQYIIAIAEKYHCRVDAQQVLACLPASITVKTLHRFLKMTFEHENAKQRNLQVAHQLLRVREVNLRTALLTPSTQRVGSGVGGVKK